MLDQQPQEMEESIKHCTSSMPHGHGTVLGRSSLAASPQERLEAPFVLPVKGAELWRLGSTSLVALVKQHHPAVQTAFGSPEYSTCQRVAGRLGGGVD